jgi:hypothetical protein
MADKELTTAEIRKLIKAHNVLMSITIPGGATRSQILKILDNKGYMVNHVKKSIQRRYKNERKPNVTLAQADEILKKPEKTALQKQKAMEAKSKREEVKKKKEREIKKEAVKKAMISKPVVKAKPAVKKPSIGKKEDDVRPKDKVGRPRFDPNKIKVIKPKSSKEDEVRPATKAKEPVFKPPVKPKKTKEERLKDRLKIQDMRKREENLKRIKKVGILIDAIDQFNQLEVGKSLKKPLRTSNESKEKLIEKIVAYDIDKVINIDIPDKVERKKMTEEEKQQKKTQIQEKGKKEKPFKGLRVFVGSLYTKYNKLLRDNEYKEVKALLKKMQNEFNEAYEELEEQAEEKDIELDDDVYEDIEGELEQNKKLLKDIAERGLKGEFTKKKPFKIDQSKQPKQTPSKVDIKIKPELNTKKIEPKKTDEKFKIGDTYLFKTKTEEIEGIVETIQEKSISVFYKTNQGEYKSRRVIKGNVVRRLGGTNYNEDLKNNFKTNSPKKQKKEEPKVDFEKMFTETKTKLDKFISQNKDLKTKDFSKFNKINDYRKEINYDLFFEVSKLNDKLRSSKLNEEQRKKVEEQRKKILELNNQIKLTYKFRKNPKQTPSKVEKGNTFQDKEQEIKQLFRKALSPELKKAFALKDKALMKKEFNKSVNILAQYLGKTGFATSIPQARRTITGGSVGRMIKGYGEGKPLNEPFIFRKINLTDIYNS